MRMQPGRLRQQIMLSEESSVFVLGSWMLIAWIAAVTILWRLGHPSWMQWIIVSFTELFLGRGVAIAKAVEMEMHPSLIIFLATYVDTITVFIFYPVLVLAYRNLLEGRFVDDRMKGIIESAEKNVERFAKYKIAGVFIFVWFPFFMTGGVVGAVLGYLLGLKTWPNMITVTLGTMSAALCWMYAYDNLYGWLETIHSEVPLIFTAILIAGLAVGRLWIKAKKKRDLYKANQPKV